ncbi:fibronectin type III domain-containing protein [Halosimplex amylolyticum]|uniref:fibronectin type III domain-containing protein n=1 Tax=Halosimplex amylolyticum TaxID=3396616 RepID=UPI003F559FAB
MTHDERERDRVEGEHPQVPGVRTDGRLSSVPSPPLALTVDGTNAETVLVSWSAPPDAGASGVDRYDVTVDGTKRGEAAPGTRRVAITDLAPDTTYAIGVAAVDEEGEASPPMRAEVATATRAGETAADRPRGRSTRAEPNSDRTDSTRRRGSSDGRSGSHRGRHEP